MYRLWNIYLHLYHKLKLDVVKLFHTWSIWVYTCIYYYHPHPGYHLIIHNNLGKKNSHFSPKELMESGCSFASFKASKASQALAHSEALAQTLMRLL